MRISTKRSRICVGMWKALYPRANINNIFSILVQLIPHKIKIKQRFPQNETLYLMSIIFVNIFMYEENQKSIKSILCYPGRIFNSKWRSPFAGPLKLFKLFLGFFSASLVFEQFDKTVLPKPHQLTSQMPTNSGFLRLSWSQ